MRPAFWSEEAWLEWLAAIREHRLTAAQETQRPDERDSSSSTTSGP